MQRAAHAYLQTQVTTTSQGDLLIMLYDGAINFLNQAKDFLAANDMAKKGIYISKTLDIINELESTLNLEKGGTLAANLHNLYSFCTNHLVKANMKKDPKMIDDVIKILGGLRSAYAEIASLPEAQAAAQVAADSIPASAHTAARAQAGTSPTGGAAPAPGASARIRNMHAQYKQRTAAEEQTPDTAATDETAARPEPAPAAPTPAENRTEAQTAAEALLSGGMAAFRHSAQFAAPANATAPAGAPAPGAPKTTVAGIATAGTMAAGASAPATSPLPPAFSGTAGPAPSFAQPQPAAAPPPQEEPAQQMPLQQGLTGGGFIRKNGTDLYRKFAGQ